MSGVAHITLRGQTPSAGTTANPIWGVGGATSYVQLTTGTALEVVSSSGNDTAAGTGARTVKINGLDGSFLPFSETKTLAGATPVALTNTSVIAINSVTVMTAGSGNTNAGNIDVRAVSGGAIKSRIASNAEAVGRASDFIFTTPANQYGLLKSIQVWGSAVTGDMLVYLRMFNTAGLITSQILGQASMTTSGFNAGQIDMKFGDGLYVPEKTLMVLLVDLSAGTSIVSANGELEMHAM